MEQRKLSKDAVSAIELHCTTELVSSGTKGEASLLDLLIDLSGCSLLGKKKLDVSQQQSTFSAAGVQLHSW
jgi:hypothetical protein